AIYYKNSQFNHFKAFFFSLKIHQRQYFKELPCYQRLIYLINTHQLALHALHTALMADHQCNYLWIDSTTLPVCKNQRIARHKSLSDIATRGKGSMGWFFGCKLHVAMNADGDMVSTTLSNGHVADIKMVEELVKGLKATIYADRGYISHDLKEKLKLQDIDLVTYHRKNMQVLQISKIHQHHLKQRNKIETLFSLLKGKYNLVTSKARSIQGYLSGIYSSLCAYQICHVNKPNIQVMNASA
ncbi:IS982 family transposase, partial [Acinetobacter sp. FNA3]|uniref:IS982 family transposase n=1 Tax=Acinetobacter pollinis TaxID=2605270 RepID=UPI0018C32688